MSRSFLALMIGLIGFLAYVGFAVALGDLVVNRHWLLQAAYYLVAGIVWVFPAKWLIVWSARGSQPR